MTGPRRTWAIAVVLAVAGVMTLAPGPTARSPEATTACPTRTAVTPEPSIDPRHQPDVTVFAAASLSDAFEDLRGPWATAHPGSDLILSFDASSALRAQIEEGAPVDIYAAADTRNAQLLVDACIAPGPLAVFAANTLVVVVPEGNPAGLGSAADLARPGVRVVAAGPDVPITRYATQVIERLAAAADDPADFASALAANVVSEEDNVRAVLTKIELGEGDAAIVYATDAASSDVVETIVIPEAAGAPARYAAVTIVDAPEPALAEAFLDFLLSPVGQDVLARHGFLAATEADRRDP